MIGTTISHYKIIEQLGAGGMGVVYKAEDTKLHRTVALKFLSANALGGQDEKTRFVNEARTAASLSHPNICTVYEIDEVDGHTFIAMECVTGRNLRQIVAEGPMKFGNATAIALQVAEGLQEAHDAGIIHRDIKSANIMLNEKGRPVIMDFGLAKQGGATAITQDGVSLGTIDYMSPEQAQGHAVDRRTDIWALGVVLFEMITGRMPFKGDKEHAVIYSIINTPVEPLTAIRTGVPMELERIVTKALAKNPDERYQSATDLMVDLRGVARDISDATMIGTSAWSAATAREKQSFVRALMQRRVPQVIGIYIVASIALVSFLEFLVNRYPVSPHLPDLGLGVLAALVPTVVMLAWFRGGRTSNGWHPVERIGIPANLVLAAIALFFIFHGKDLGATTTAVEVADESGNTVAREIPKSEFRKRVAIFYFDNKTGDPEMDWMSYGLVNLLRFDLYQDAYLTVSTGFTDRQREAGFPEGVGSPLTLKRKIADDLHYPFFIAGSFGRTGNEYHIKASVYESNDAKALFANDYKGSDFFALIDELSIDARKVVDLPAYHIAESQDLPVSEIVTASPEALEGFSRAGQALRIDNDWEAALAYLTNALEKDPAFAVGYWRLAGVYMNLNRGKDAEKAIGKALEHKYKLPERIQIQLTAQYYRVLNDEEAEFANAKRFVTLYPGEVDAHEMLAAQYERKRMLDEAIASRMRVRELEPEDYDQLQQIGRLYEVKGEFSKALEYFQQYADQFPDKYESFTRIGDLYQAAGEHEKAREYYNKASLIEPQRISIRVTLAQIELSLGNLEAAENACKDAVSRAATPQDSVTALTALTQLHALRGQCNLAIKDMNTNVDAMSRFMSPLNIAFINLFTAPLYVQAGRADEAWRRLEAIESSPTMIPHMKPIISVGYLISYFSSQDPSYLDEAKPHLAKFEAWVEQSGTESLRWALEWSRAGVFEFEDKNELALESIQKALDNISQSQRREIVSMNGNAARLCHKMKRYEQGITYAQAALAIEPFDPVANHWLAVIYHDMGDREKAINHLSRALYVFEPADKVNPQAKDVWATRDAWESEGIHIQ